MLIWSNGKYTVLDKHINSTQNCMLQCNVCTHYQPISLTLMVPLESTSTAKPVRCLVTHVMVVEFVFSLSKNTPSSDHPPVEFLKLRSSHTWMHIFWKLMLIYKNTFNLNFLFKHRIQVYIFWEKRLVCQLFAKHFYLMT